MSGFAGVRVFSRALLRTIPRELGLRAPVVPPDLATAQLDDIYQGEQLHTRPMRVLVQNLTWPYAAVIRTYTAEFTQQITAARFNLKVEGVALKSFTAALSKVASVSALGSITGGDTSLLEKTVKGSNEIETIPGFAATRGVRGPIGFYLNVGESISLIVSIDGWATGVVPGSLVAGSATLEFQATGRQQK